MIEVAIFDADDVTINKPKIFSQRFSAEFNVPIEKMLQFFRGEFQKCLVGQADLKIELTKYSGLWGWKKSVDDLLAYWFKSEDYTDHKLIEQITTLQAHGIKCYSASNQEKYRANYITNQMKYNTIFDGLFFSCDLGLAKPDIQFFKKMYTQIGSVPKNKILFWDDDERNIASAKAFGFNAEIYTTFPKFQKILTRYLA